MRARTGLTAYATAALVGGALVADVTPAKACGGCFHAPSEVTVVNEHRMVLSVSKTQTVLWDQIRYSGNPSEFAWVLPVKPGAKIELSHDEFIAALDAYTQPVITGPAPAPAQSNSGGVGCGSPAVYSSASESDRGGTTVVSQQVVGPYEAVTLHAASGDSIEAWLTAHRYQISATIKPIVDAYVKEQFDFIALRLLPGKDVAAMQPVRVVTQGADPTLPLRMVAAGVGQQVGVLLYVIAEGRYEVPAFSNGEIHDAQLTWNAGTNQSNYSQLSDAFMTSGPKPGVLTEFAGHAFSRDFVNPNGNGFRSPGQFVPGCASGSGLADAYGCAVATAAATSSNAKCDGGASPGDLRDSAAAFDDASTSEAGADASPGGFEGCNFDDVEVATKGMANRDVWVTRLRMHLPVSALAADLKVGASSPQALVSPYHQVGEPADSGGCTTAGGNANTWVGIGLGALGLGLLARRRRTGA